MIFLDTNVVSETLRLEPDSVVQAWLEKNDEEIALSSIVIAAIAFGIAKIAPHQRARRLEEGLSRWRRRFVDRIFSFTEEAALNYGELMGSGARRGQQMSVQDGMIAAVASVNGGRLATRNQRHFEGCGLDLINPWQQ